LLASSWVAGAVGLVALASSWDAVWWLLVPWGVIGAVAWGGAVALPGAPPVLSVPLVAALLAGQGLS
jgi:hypothetical protein